MMLFGITNIVILDIHGIDYLCIIFRVSKMESINMIENADLDNEGSL